MTPTHFKIARIARLIALAASLVGAMSTTDALAQKAWTFCSAHDGKHNYASSVFFADYGNSSTTGDNTISFNMGKEFQRFVISKYGASAQTYGNCYDTAFNTMGGNTAVAANAQLKQHIALYDNVTQTGWTWNGTITPDPPAPTLPASQKDLLPLSAGIAGTGPCAPGKGGPGPQGAWCGKLVGKYATMGGWDCRNNSASEAGCPFRRK